MTILLSICAVLLVPLAGAFGAIDQALVTVSAARVEDLVKDGRLGARHLRDLLAGRATYVSLVVLLRIVSEVAAAVLVAIVTTDHLGLGWGAVVAIVVVSVVDYVAIGVGPRTLGRQHAYSIGCATALPMKVVGSLLNPLSRLLILIGNAITPGRGFRNGPFASEVELREVVDLAERSGVVAADERRMIQSVFELGDTCAREVMVPRPEMVWIEAEKTVGQAASLAVRSGHSRIPVIGENTDDILGVVRLSDMVLADRNAAVGTLMREAQFLPDSKPLDAVLTQMQRTRNHMAMVVDEYGGIAGLLTIEDVLEEIVGEIVDETDTETAAPIAALDPTDPAAGYRVSSRLSIDDLGELFDVEFDVDDVETVGGLLGFELGRVPLPGSTITTHGLRMRAEGGPDRRGRLRITDVVVVKTGSPDGVKDAEENGISADRDLDHG